MSINSLLTRTYKQSAVYWGNPVKDGEGGFTFDDPVEIVCRWEEMNQIVSDSKGNELTSRAVVYLLQDVDEEGYLYLGDLTGLVGTSGSYVIFTDGTTIVRKGMRNGCFMVDKALTTLGFGTGGVEGVDWENIMGTTVSEESTPLADSNAPISLNGAYIIKRFQKIPSLGSTTDFLRKAYLTPSLSFGGF